MKGKHEMKARYTVSLLAAAIALLMTSAPMQASETDDRIESSAKHSYVFKTYLNNDDIQIRSKDGVVTLNGTVSVEVHKQLARETVASLRGVKSVNNKLTLKGEAPAEHSDAWLVMEVKTGLLFHSSVRGLATEVDVKDGVVTLRGDAASKEQKDLTTEYAKDVDGVKEVKNEMTVAKTSKEQGENATGKKMDAVSESVDDASITALVKTALLHHRSTRGLNTKVETKDGVVTLSGKAINTAGKKLVTKFVSDVHGVKKVVNNMTVQ
jgi:hyperosmotically inducible periplasmic protein